MDRKSVIVLSICFVLFVLWAQVVPVLYPPTPIARTNTVASLTNTIPATNATTALEAPRGPAVPWTAPTPGAPEELVVLTNEVARYTFTSHGGGLKVVELLKYPESVARGSKSSILSNRVATLNAQAQQPVLALAGSEALAGDSVYKISKFTDVGGWNQRRSHCLRRSSGEAPDQWSVRGERVRAWFELPRQRPRSHREPLGTTGRAAVAEMGRRRGHAVECAR
ncbi:MAG: hypothetical protein IPK15_10065 [Verrucomicrobia bacterium]|nr:hypothetical protein [Verrucomicrobiota bacterium]